MKLNKKLMAMTLVGSLAVGGMAVGASQKTETVTRHYRNIQVKVNGDKEVPVNEPFMIGNSVYVGLRDAGNLVGADIAWDGATNTVLVETSGGDQSEIDALKSELGSKNFQLATANSKIEDLEEKLAQYEDNEDSDKDDDDKVTIKLSALEDFLEDEFQDEHDVEWTFELSGDEDGLELEIKYDSDEHGDEFDDIREDELEEFVEEICDAIQKEVEDEYDVKHVEIEGEIYDVEEKETKAEFDMDDRGRFDFENKKSKEIDEDELKDYMEIIDSNYENFPKVNLGAYDSNSIRVKNITAREDDGEIIFEVWTTMDDYLRGAWDNMNSSDADPLEKYMKDLNDKLEGEFDVDVRGYVYDHYKDEMASYNGTLKLEKK